MERMRQTMKEADVTVKRVADEYKARSDGLRVSLSLSLRVPPAQACIRVQLVL